MSFSSDVKMELAGNVPGARHCQIAELAAMISMVAYVRYWAGRPAGLVIVTERSVIAKEIASLIKRLFRYIPDSSVRRTGADSRVYEDGDQFSRDCQYDTDDLEDRKRT